MSLNPIPEPEKLIAELSLQRLLGKLNSVVLIVGDDNQLLHVYGDSRQIFKFPKGWIGTDVDYMILEALRLPLNTALGRARQERQTIEYAGIKFEQTTKKYQAKLTVIPPEADADLSNFYLVEITVEAAVDVATVEQFPASSDDLGKIFVLEQELQHTQDNLQTLVEELKTINEELTTANEELQSTNEELYTVNIEHQSKISELTQLNNDVNNLLKSTDIGVIFLDSKFNIRKFTPAARIAVSLRNTDLERPLSDLYLKIDCDNLEELLAEVQSDQTTIKREVKLKNRDSYLLMRIHPYQTDTKQNDGVVISFFDINEVKLVQFQLEEALTEIKSKETEINNFFHLSLEIMCVANLDGYFKRINPSFARILGYTTQELLTQPFISFVHPDDKDNTLQAVQQLSEEKEVAGFENRYRCQDGSYRWFKWMAASYQGLIYATAHDLTEQKLARELQDRQLAAMETATNGIAILNENKFIYVNQAHLDMFGYSQAKELLGQSWRILYEPERLVQFDREILPVLQDKGKWQGIVKARHKKGHTFDEDLTLTFSRTGDLICVCQDISDRLEIERSLIESEKKYRYLYENTPVMLHSIDSQGRILSVSKYWLETMGYSQAEVIGKKSSEFLTLESQQHAREILSNFFKTGSCYNVFYQWVRKDGSIIDGLLSAISEMSNGKIVRSLAVVVDITEQRQKEKLEEANRAKDNFIAHMSHELRTPLNSIIGFSHILKKDSRLIPEQLKSIDLINQSGQHLLTLINDILDLSKLTANKLELQNRDLNLADFINNIAAIFDIRAQDKGVSFISELSDDLPKVVRADETKLRQVLLNLLSNAVKFTSNGTVTLSISSLTANSDSRLRTIRFAVEDTGKGIPEDKYDTVFAPFGQLDPSSQNAEGTGLGLPICQNIINLMDSELNLTSEIGRGSRFWFDLNLEEVSSPLSSPEINSEAVIVRRLATPCKVLVVDDNQDNRLLLIEYLQALGFTVTEAENGREGIAVAREFQPDAILIDLMMPVMDGKKAIAAIRQDNSLKDTTILMISANVRSIVDSSDIKCDGFLAKPIDLEQLLKVLEQHLDLNWQSELTELNSSETNEVADFIAPDRDKLLELLELVTWGNMKDLCKQIELLEETNSQYICFAQQVRQLADNYEQNKLQKLIQKSLESAR